MKKFLTLSMILVLGACGNNTTAKKVKVGVLAHTFADQQATYLYDAIQKAAANYPDMDLTILDAKDDSGTQFSQMENLITTGNQAVIVYTVDRPTFGAMAQLANNAGVKVIAVNRLPEPQHITNMDYYVGIDEREAGITMGNKLIADLTAQGRINENMEIVILLGILGSDAALERTAGFKQAIARYPNLRVTREGTARWERALAITLMENWLQADTGNRIKVVFGNNDEMAIGARLAAEQAGRTDIVFYGVDAIPPAVELIGNGLEATIQQDTTTMGSAVVEIAYKSVVGEPIENLVNEKFRYIPLLLVDSNNKSEFLQAITAQ